MLRRKPDGTQTAYVGRYFETTQKIVDDFEYTDSPLNHDWKIYTGSGSIATVTGSGRPGRVLRTTTSQGTGFGIRYPASGSIDVPLRELSVWIEDTDTFYFYVKVHATNGSDYYIRYQPTGGSPYASGSYAIVPVGTQYRNGSWHELRRDLGADLRSVFGVGVEYVKWFCIRGNYDLDDLELTDPTKYYYAGRRVAMREGGVVQYLHTDHLGSTSLATNDSGVEVTGSRTLYYPYGEQRWSASGGTLATDYTFTGQRNEAGIGLMDYNARFYDPYLGRFISADAIVPDPGNPQDLNRYAYVRNNPLRYVDPTGYYSEEEIMTAFGVSTWDEVLASFKAGELEGKWGWLEVLRQANDCDWVMGSIYDGLHYSDGFDFPEIGRIYMGSNGEITIGGVSQIEFAARWGRYSLDSAVHGEYDFSTDAEAMYWHARLVGDPRPLRDRPEDMSGMLGDGISIFLDVGSAIGMWTLHPEMGLAFQGGQLLVDALPAIDGFANIFFRRQQNVGYNSDDVLGAVGWIPWAGSVPDLISVASHYSGYKVVWTP